MPGGRLRVGVQGRDGQPSLGTVPPFIPSLFAVSDKWHTLQFTIICCMQLMEVRRTVKLGDIVTAAGTLEEDGFSMATTAITIDLPWAQQAQGSYTPRRLTHPRTQQAKQPPESLVAALLRAAYAPNSDCTSVLTVPEDQVLDDQVLDDKASKVCKFWVNAQQCSKLASDAGCLCAPHFPCLPRTIPAGLAP